MIKYAFLGAAFLLFFNSSTYAAAVDGGSLSGFCTSCHGMNGSGPGETIPHIGGQTKEYLALSMTEMKEKKRYATLMQTIAQGYDPDEIELIATWFSQQKWVNSENKIDATLAEQGKATSDLCAACHGDKGEGAGETPRIGGQASQYLYYALLEYKNKVRNNDGGASLMEIVVEMDEKELKALAEYYSSLR